MSLLVNERGGYRGKLTTMGKQVKELWDTKSTVKHDYMELQALESTLLSCISKIQELDCQISSSVTDASQQEKEAQSVEQYTEAGWDTQTKISLLIKKFAPPSENASESNFGSAKSVRRVSTKLPKLELVKFNGDPLIWQEFWDSFKHAVHENEDLSEIEKFQHLRNQLTDEAKKVADGYRLTAANYVTVIDELKDRFGSEETAIFAHFDRLLALPVASTDTQRLQEVYDLTESHIRSLVNLGLTEETFGQVFTPIILSKLPRAVRTDLHRKNGSNRWTLSNLRDLFRDELKARRMGEWTLGQDGEKRQGKSGQGQSGGTPKTPPNSKPWDRARPFGTGGALGSTAGKGSGKSNHEFARICIFCKGNHRHAECKQVTSVEQRKELARGLCFKCLKKGHMSKNCPKPPKCFYCGQTSHHSSLCRDQFASPRDDGGNQGGSSPKPFGKSGTSHMNPDAPPFPDPSGSPGSTSCSGVGEATDKSVFIQMQMASVKLGKDDTAVRMFFDGGCSWSYITSQASKRLGLKVIGKKQISNGRFEDTRRRTHTYPIVELGIPAPTGTIPLTLLVTDNIACPVTRVPISPDRYPLIRQISLADPPPIRPENVTIDILIGNDQYFQIVGHERIELAGGLMLLGSKLGYITSGPVLDVQFGNLVEPSYLSAILGEHKSSVSFQNTDLERFWSLEDIGVKDDSDIKDDDLALQRFNDSIRFNGERYEVGWPWKSDQPELTSNYDLSLSRLKSQVKRLQKDPELLQVYHRTIKDQLQAGVVEPVPETTGNSTLVHYLPHHCVVKPDRSTTKVRIVYDGSAKPAQSLRSLNESLLRGPVFLQELCGMLLRFRQNQFAVTADIEKAFLQVSLKPADRDVTRFLWLRDPTGPVSNENLIVYRFCRVLFGIISSPFLLDGTIKHFLRESKLPMADVLADGIYVDNLIVGASSEIGIQQIYESARHIFAENGMNIRDWTSNSGSLIKNIPSNQQASGCPVKVLGLSWDYQTDELGCSIKASCSSDVTTKRHLVSAASKAFDPCGFVSPVILQAKILVQETWARKIKWDQKLPSDICDRWLLVSESMEAVPNIKIPRFLGVPITSEYQIHCFCDASCKAYTGVVYLKASADAPPRLLFSKAKLAPLKAISMPRLELMGVRTGCRMTNYVTHQMNLKPVRVFVWSDSKCVLQWVKSNKILSVFVENRVREIQSYGFELRYVPTKENPADISSRGCTLTELQNNNLWWQGPAFLMLPESKWPSCRLEGDTHTDPSEIEEFSIAALMQSDPPISTVFEIERWSSLTKTVRVTAWVFRFCSNLRKKIRDNRTLVLHPTLSASELDHALKYWIQSVQKSDLTPSGTSHAKIKNLWRQLGVFEDPDGFYRCKGRLKHASIPEAAKYPLLLPKRHPFTSLVVKDIHARNMHSGVTQTHSILQQTYWVPQARSLVKGVLGKCTLCRKFQGGPFAVPPFPPLPDFRLEDARPFRNVGVDYFGPLYIKSCSAIAKVWVCLFTCASSRAVHLEVVTDMSTSQFLLALRRFIALYNPPLKLISDNAKHFKLANNFLQRLWAEVVNSDEVQNFSSTQGIDWVFIPEYAPWMGGFYERLVGTVKSSLKKALGRQTLSLVQLQTIIVEACSVVNSRPLVAAKDDLSPILTPSDLLGKSRGFPVQQGKPYAFLQIDLPENSDKTIKFGPSKSDDLLEFWKDNRKILDHFWQTWSSEYLSSLRDQQSAHHVRNASIIEPKLGTVVIIKTNSPRSTWSLGKITHLKESADGFHRSAEVRLATGKTVIRPIKLLYPIESTAIDDHETVLDSTEKSSDTKETSVKISRRAAQEARQKIKAQLDQDNTVMFATDCSFISAIRDKMPDVDHAFTKDSPLARLFSQHRFHVGPQLVTSVEMGAWYMVLVAHGFGDLATELVNHPGLLNNASGIAPWLEQVEFREAADVNIMLNIDRFYYEAARLCLYSHNSLMLLEFQFFQGAHPDARIHFIACSKQEYVFSAGVGINFPGLDNPDSWPGFNVYGEAITTLFGCWAFGDPHADICFEDFSRNTTFFGTRFQSAALVVSDSQSRHLRSMEYSEVVRKTGATFRDLAATVTPQQIQSPKYIIILAGTNMTRGDWTPEAWESEWDHLLGVLRPRIDDNRDTQILINGPIWNLDHRAEKVPQFTDWLAAKVEPFRNITLFSWSAPFDNPFVIKDEHGRLRENPDYYDTDRFHVNKAGFLLFWRRWCYTFPNLQLLSVKITNPIWQPLNQPHVPHSVNQAVKL